MSCKVLMNLATLFFFSITAWTQVIDVNGDNLVGPHEAIAVHESWKGAASASNEHTHFGQTWIPPENSRGLTIRGDFPDRNRIIIGPLKEAKQTGFTPGGALILDNTAPDGADLLLGGDGVIEALDETESEIVLRANGDIAVVLDADNNDGAKDFLVRRYDEISVFGVTESGNFFYLGVPITKTDHPLDPKNKTLSHIGVSSSETLNVYSGTAVLDKAGESWVELPSYFEAYNKDYRYTLTPVGGPAASLHVAEKVQNNQFKIAGGYAGLEVSWQVTGVRNDPVAKFNAILIEDEKVGPDKGKLLHPLRLGADNE